MIEASTELGTSTTSGDIAAQVAAATTAGFTTVVTTADGSQASASGVDNGSGGQATLVAINTDDSSQARQKSRQEQPEIINRSPKDEKDHPQGEFVSFVDAD